MVAKNQIPRAMLQRAAKNLDKRQTEDALALLEERGEIRQCEEDSPKQWGRIYKIRWIEFVD